MVAESAEPEDGAPAARRCDSGAHRRDSNVTQTAVLPAAAAGATVAGKAAPRSAPGHIKPSTQPTKHDAAARCQRHGSRRCAALSTEPACALPPPPRLSCAPASLSPSRFNARPTPHDVCAGPVTNMPFKQAIKRIKTELGLDASLTAPAAVQAEYSSVSKLNPIIPCEGWSSLLTPVLSVKYLAGTSGLNPFFIYVTSASDSTRNETISVLRPSLSCPLAICSIVSPPAMKLDPPHALTSPPA